MRIFAVRDFDRFASRHGITDATLLSAVERAEAGRVDAHLGGEIVKIRIARPNQGRRGGYRTLVAYRRGDRAVFLNGLAKNDRANFGSRETALAKEIGGGLLDLGEEEVELAVQRGTLREVTG